LQFVIHITSVQFNANFIQTIMQNFITQAQYICGKENVWTDYLRTLTYGTDASFYRYQPKVVVNASSEEEVIKLIQLADQQNISITFRAAGTSLSGQTISDTAIILLKGNNWKKYKLTAGGEVLITQPGLKGIEANGILKKFARKIGPDPASINSAMLGGIVANNASGMSSGVVYNSYNTLSHLRLVLSDGIILDTSDQNSRNEFLQSKKEFVKEILQLKAELESNPLWKAKIESKYKIKNTIAYGLNSFIDFSDPIDIIAHLIVGSEGTLAFISEIGMKTLKIGAFSASALIFFANLEQACQAAIVLNGKGTDAIELIDRKALKSVEKADGIPAFISELDAQVTALLVRIEADSKEELDNLLLAATEKVNNYKLVKEVQFTDKPTEIAKLWNVRKGIFPSVGGNRQAGTTVFIEDVAVVLEKLPAALADLRHLLDKYEYTDGVIYGHANDGNVHFIFSSDMSQAENVQKYKHFMHEVAELIVHKYDGSLKAEHGTGRNMAPYVAFEWGNDLYEIHKRIKQLFDPKGILNKGVIINNDAEIHIKNIKIAKPAHHLIDNCIECGFCEINCVTNELTLSARQRIVAFRELKRIEDTGELSSEYEILKADFYKQGVDSCAGDGLCALSCPVGIDTGILVKHLRNEQHEGGTQFIANKIADNMPNVLAMAKFGLTANSIAYKMLGTKNMKSLAKFVRKASFGLVPEWTEFMPVANRIDKFEPYINGNERKVLFFPSCISRSMGAASNGKKQDSQFEVTMRVLKRAGFTVLFPDNLNALCCGMPWESKGYFKIADRKSSQLEQELLKASNNGEIPILVDTSPCLYRMRKVMQKDLKMYEPVEFALDFLMNNLTIHKIPEKVALHSTCTTTKLGLKEKLLQLGNLCAQEAIIPENVGCCGFAGDKGFSQPEINEWGLRHLKEEVHGCKSAYSNSKTCEIGLSTHSGIEYQSVFYLIDKASKEV